MGYDFREILRLERGSRGELGLWERMNEREGSSLESWYMFIFKMWEEEERVRENSVWIGWFFVDIKWE